jgi:sterol desaturase/sphingolipid hydroxylase (fatty acid hydroxylase superfamily)
MTLAILLAVGAGLIVIERLYPAADLPRVRAWWPRVILVNLVQLGLVVVAGLTWDRWMQGASLLPLRDWMGPWAQALVAYVVSSFIYYWWHRLRHESRLFWLLCHQLHHSPRRIEVVTAFYKHPVEIALNSILSAAIVYLALGCSVEAGAYYTLLTALAEFFYHWNVRTPRWLGCIIQRPEAHRVHHQHRRHTGNFADLPVFDMLFGTFRNPERFEGRCGFDEWREEKLEDMLIFRDVNGDADRRAPVRFLPTCIGCRKRWACGEQNSRAVEQ